MLWLFKNRKITNEKEFYKHSDETTWVHTGSRVSGNILIG